MRAQLRGRLLAADALLEASAAIVPATAGAAIDVPVHVA